MAEMVKKATRESYGAALAELGEKYKNLVVLDADLAKATKTEVFLKKFPERFYECGISEANMMGVAAGLSTCGKIPFASSFAMFAAGRAYEIIRNSIAYPHLNVKIGATHAGITVGEDGATHQCLEDIALMRAIPGMVVINPCDDTETKAAVEAAILHEGPVYLRFGRLAVENINNGPDYHFELGKGIQLKDGNDAAIIATGLMVQESLKAAKILEDEGIHVRVINLHTIKPLDEEIVLKAARETGLLFTAEEHSIVGGLGEAVASVISENCPVKVHRIGVKDRFGYSGPAGELLKQFELTGEDIAKKVKASL